MICAKVFRKDIEDFLTKYNEKIDKKFEFVFEGNYALVPLKEVIEGAELVECNPKERNVGKKLRDYIKGLRSYEIVGDIVLVSPKVEVDKEELYRAIKELFPKARAVFIRKRVVGDLRINELEFAGGEYTTETVYKENGIALYVDVSKVYVNVTLANERARTAEDVCKIKSNEPVLDTFTGYGPLALLVAKKGCYVVAGDLNAEGLSMAKRSIEMNRAYNIDLVQYDASHLPFRDKAFSIAVADNPTMANLFKDEVCRVSRIAIFYVLARSPEDASRLLGHSEWLRVNDYSKDLFVFKGSIRCDDISSEGTS